MTLPKKNLTENITFDKEEIELRKKLVRCYFCSIALYDSETCKQTVPNGPADRTGATCARIYFLEAVLAATAVLCTLPEPGLRV